MSWLPFLAVPAGILISLSLTFLFTQLLAWVQVGVGREAAVCVSVGGLVVRGVLLVGDESMASIYIVGLFSEANC